MLQGLAALRLGGWRGLGRGAGAETSVALRRKCAADRAAIRNRCCPPSDVAADSYSSVQYTYAPDGRLLSETRSGGEIHTYSYGHVS
jgi:hypothetical protein